MCEFCSRLTITNQNDFKMYLFAKYLTVENQRFFGVFRGYKIGTLG